MPYNDIVKYVLMYFKMSYKIFNMIDITIEDREGNTINKKVFGWEIKDNIIYLFNESGKRISAYPCIWHRVENVEGDFEKSIK